MKRFYEPAFTIIETTLFLAISALLVVGVLVGTGASINRQRYFDSVTTLQSIIQEQYSEVENVSNSREDNWTCDETNGQIEETETGSGINRGQSKCILLGKLIVSADEGKTINIKDVIGLEPSGYDLPENDLEALISYQSMASPVIDKNYTVQWGVSMVKPGEDSNINFSVLILNSPVSGAIKTFIDPNNSIATDDLTAMISDANKNESLKICLDPDALFVGEKMAVFIDSGSASASGVRVLGSDSGC